jgi:SAM domain (Sterile alpha motif)
LPLKLPEWSAEHVSVWLQKQVDDVPSSTRALFFRQGVDGNRLSQLSASDLSQGALSIADASQRQIILNAIRDLQVALDNASQLQVN